jgi:hypothetical protein
MNEAGTAWLVTTPLLAGLCLRATPQGDAPPVPRLTVSRATTFVTEPLRADGTPDYAAWLNRKYSAGVTPENNAALMFDGTRVLGGIVDVGPIAEELRKRLDTNGEVPGIGRLPERFRDAFSAQHVRASLAPWRVADAPLIAAWLRMNEASLSRIVEVTRTRNRWWVPLSSSSLAFDARIPSLSWWRHAADALRVRALESVARDDHASARRDLIAGLRLGALLEQGPWITQRLIALAVRGIAAEPVVALANPPASVGEARDLLRDLMQAPPSVPLDDFLDVDQRLEALASYVELYRAARTSPRAWKGRMNSIFTDLEQMAAGLSAPPPSLAWKKLQPWAIDWNELLMTVNRCWQNPACDAELKEWAHDLEPARLDGLLADARNDGEARHRIARAFLGLGHGYGSSFVMRARIAPNEGEAIRHVALVSAAAAVSRAETGRYPATASAIATVGFDPGVRAAGYAFQYASSADGSRFAYTAVPEKPGETVVRGFCADSSGRLAFTPDGARPALVGGLCDPAARALAARTPP